MKAFRTNEEPPRLVVVCRNADEHEGLVEATDLYAIRVRQTDRITGGVGDAANRVAGLRMDLAETALKFALPDATSRERVVVTESNKLDTLRDVAANAVDELAAEPKVQDGIGKAVWGADAQTTRSPYYAGQARRYWTEQETVFSQSLGSLPVIEFAPETAEAVTANPV